MARHFNITGLCVPDRHYMVNLSERLAAVRRMIDRGDYFTVNRARQYGKTTMLHALAKELQDQFTVVRIDFQSLGSASYKNEDAFSRAFAACFIKGTGFLGENTKKEHAALQMLKEAEENQSRDFDLRKMFELLQMFCVSSQKPVVLMIDEADSASDNQLFLDFLAQLRSYYTDEQKDLPIRNCA